MRPFLVWPALLLAAPMPLGCVPDSAASADVVSLPPDQPGAETEADSSRSDFVDASTTPTLDAAGDARIDGARDVSAREVGAVLDVADVSDVPTSDARAMDAVIVDAPTVPPTCPVAASALTSTGAEGAFSPTVDVVLSPGVHHFTTIHVPAGVTVRSSGDALDLRALGAVTILGAIDMSGGAGRTGPACVGTLEDGGRCDGGPGGATGHPGFAASGQGRGGAHRHAIDFMLATQEGGNGGAGLAGGGGGIGERSGLDVGTRGRDGDGPNGGVGANFETIGFPVTCRAIPAGGGRATNPVDHGRDGDTFTFDCAIFPVFFYARSGGGGGSMGVAAASDPAMCLSFHAGSGGGGGGCPSGTGRFPAGFVGGGGGGGGGGALRSVSPVSNALGPTARLLAVGGSGTGGGGGGSGGAIFLASPSLVIPMGATVQATGGIGGDGIGGAGGVGRVRLSARESECSLGGTFTPPLAVRCAPSPRSGVPGRVHVTAWPD